MLTINDFVIAPLYLAIIIAAMRQIKNTVSEPIRKYFMPAFYTKVLGAIAFALIYTFYYGEGDTSYFFRGANMVSDALYYNPLIYFKILTLDAGEYRWDTERFTRFSYFRSSEEFNVVKIASVLSILSFKTYLVMAWVFGIYCFAGMWQAFLVFYRLFPKYHFILFVAFFLSPSSVFWGSGLMKDTLTMGAACFVFAGVANWVLFNRLSLTWIILVLISGYLIFVIKAYILFFMLPGLFTFIYLALQSKIKFVIIKTLALPILLVIFGLSGYFATRSLMLASDTFSSERAIMKKIEGFHGDHGSMKTGSTYNLGPIEYTYAGILRKSPQALIVTLYRPFLWEVGRSPVVLLSALESLTYLLATVLALMRVWVVGFFVKLFQSPLFLFCVLFVVIMGVGVGLVAFNFGALARFKIPIMPFFGVALVMMYYRLR